MGKGVMRGKGVGVGVGDLVNTREKMGEIFGKFSEYQFVSQPN